MECVETKLLGDLVIRRQSYSYELHEDLVIGSVTCYRKGKLVTDKVTEKHYYKNSKWLKDKVIYKLSNILE